MFLNQTPAEASSQAIKLQTKRPPNYEAVRYPNNGIWRKVWGDYKWCESVHKCIGKNRSYYL